MNTRTARGYRSKLREDQAEATGRLIVDATVRVLERGPAALSIPAVAREAGVAVATVYQHYRDKAALVRAVSDHLDRANGIAPPPPMSSPAELAYRIQSLAPRLNGRHALMLPALRSPEGAAVRREQIAARTAMVRAALVEASARLDPVDAAKLISIVTVLCTSETLGLLQEYLGLSGEEAGAAVAWAITHLSEEHPK